MDILQKNILEVKDLTKDYPGFHLKMDLAVPAGSIMGLVGPNGAGKSTTLRLILGLAHPDSGSIQVLGCSDLNKAPALREDIGVVFDECSFPEMLDAAQIGKVLGKIHPRWDKARYEQLLKRLELPWGKKIKDFSSFEKNPVTRDPRTEAQIRAYREKEQARARYLRDKKQWERYRETLGDGVPKSFETFRRHKLAGDEKYKIWRLDYKRQNDLVLHPEKALPGAATASAAEAKFTKYFFNPENQNGWRKGVAFSSRLGYNGTNWQKMRAEILKAAQKYPATLRGASVHGSSYSQDVILYGLKGNPANVQIGWIVHPDGTLHLVTAHMEDL